jgi:rhamnose transport system substrate-binding protein
MTASTSAPTAMKQIILAVLLLGEVVLFSVIGTNFCTLTNFLEIGRTATELGLIALAMTTVIVTGGIDLSVGSMLGLFAVVFGKLWRDAHFLWPVAMGFTLLLGAAGGALNAAVIARLKIHPLIVTLATMSLFRGIALGITGGADNFTHFPATFLSIGQGYIRLGFIGPIPSQLPIFVAGCIAFYLLLHRSIIGRALSVIGFSPEGARYAGLPVQRRIALPYVLSGLMAALAAIIYAARVGQAKADAGSEYELQAIAAVVLGGTSIFGGYATIVGTLLGLCAIEVLKNGLILSDLPPQLAGVSTSVLLLLAIGLDHHMRRRPGKVEAAQNQEEEPVMKNSQLAVISVVILASAFIVVGGNYVLVRGLAKDLSGPRVARGNGEPASRPLVIGMMPKSVGNAYFVACQKGATDAASELGDTLLWDGPTDSDPGKQNEIVETWITRGVDAIAVSADNAAGVSSALRKAMADHIKVLTWDADAEPDARDFFVNQATAQGIGEALMDNAARVMDDKGKFAIITASLTAANQNEWMKYIEKERATKFPDIQMTVVRPCDDQQAKAFDEATAIMNSDPNVKLILAISSAAVPGAAEAVKQSGRSDVHVVGLGLPNDNKPYVHAGITPAVILWNTMDLGYLTIYASHAAVAGTLTAGSNSLDAGRLGKKTVDGQSVLLGVPYVFTKDNIDQFDF